MVQRGCSRENFVRYDEWGISMFKIPDFTEFDLQNLRENGNLTIRERTLLDLRNQEISIEECAEIMNMSVSTVSRTIKKLQNKSERLGIRVE